MKQRSAILAAALVAASYVVSGSYVASSSYVASGFPPPLRAFHTELRRGQAEARSAKAGSRTSRNEIDALIKKSGADVAIAMRTLDGRDELLINPDVEYHAASTMKVPVMIELFRQVRAGAVALDDQVPVVNEFHSIVDGSPFRLDLGDDSDDAVYKRVGGRMSYRDLCEAMITVSSNLAANLIIEHLGAGNIQKTTSTLGAPGMHVLRGVEDDKAFQKGLNNSTTARALMTLMEKIAKGEAVDKASSDEMVAILKHQKFNDRIPAGLPAGTPVAHKTGEITRIQHDAAIVYADRPFVLVILVRGLDDPKRGSALAADITRVVYAALNPHSAGDNGPSAVAQASGPAVNPTAQLPYPITADELTRMHGNDARVSVESLRQGTDMIYRTLVGVAGKAR